MIQGMMHIWPIVGRVPYGPGRVIDGDSVEVALDMGEKDYKVRSVRLYGIDAPELNKHRQRGAGIVARSHAQWWLDEFQKEQLWCWSIEKPKYHGRLLGHIFWTPLGSRPSIEFRLDVSISSYMLSTLVAVPYSGGPRHEWRDDELRDIEAKRLPA